MELYTKLTNNGNRRNMNKRKKDKNGNFTIARISKDDVFIAMWKN